MYILASVGLQPVALQKWVAVLERAYCVPMPWRDCRMVGWKTLRAWLAPMWGSATVEQMVRRLWIQRSGIMMFPVFYNGHCWAWVYVIIEQPGFLIQTFRMMTDTSPHYVGRVEEAFAADAI